MTLIFFLTHSLTHSLTLSLSLSLSLVVSITLLFLQNSVVQHSETFQTNNSGTLSPPYLPSITSDLGSNIINSSPEQPLDLSLHSRSKSELSYEQIVNDKSLLKIPQPSTAKPR